MMEQAINLVVHGVGHWLMVPALAVLVAALYPLAGVDVTNISISIMTLLLLPILQHSQNKDGAAIQAKLDELIKATAAARDDLIGIDKKTEMEIEELRA